MPSMVVPEMTKDVADRWVVTVVPCGDDRRALGVAVLQACRTLRLRCRQPSNVGDELISVMRCSTNERRGTTNHL